MTTTSVPVPAVVEHDGMLWRPKCGATVSAREFIAARTRIFELQHESRWNPWVMDDHKAGWDAAIAAIERWTRAEPDFRPKTARQIDVWMARMDREFEAERKRRDREHEGNRKRYDPKREAARHALLEDLAYERHLLQELDEYRSGRRFPAMATDQREAEIPNKSTS